MPWMNRHIGNPLLSGFLNLLYKTNVRDVHCGMRALRRDVLPGLDLNSTGMEFASEMVIRAAKLRWTSASSRSSTTRARASRSSRPSTTAGGTCASSSSTARTRSSSCPGRDAPLGALLTPTVFANVSIAGRNFDVHTLIGGSLLLIIGIQVVGLGLCARAYGVTSSASGTRRSSGCAQVHARARPPARAGRDPRRVVPRRGDRRHLDLPRVRQPGRGAARDPRRDAMSPGIQVFFTSFLLSILGLRRPE